MRASRLVLCVVLGSTLACAKKLPPPQVQEVSLAPAPPPAPALPPLYERLGGKDGVAGIVESFVSNATTDKRVNRFFAKTTGPKLDYFKVMLNAQICDISGGGCDYTGKTMMDAHAGMQITDALFDAIMQDFSLALEERQVGKDAQKELLDKLAAMHDDVVGAHRKAP
jgi:hemoglobin